MYPNSYLNTVDLTALKEYFVRNGVLKEFPENAVFQEEGSKVKQFGFIRRGGVIYCRESYDGKTFIGDYAFENSFIGEYSSFKRDRTSDICIKTIEPSSIYILSARQITEFIGHSIENTLLFRSIVEEMYFNMRERLISFYTLSPQERYVRLLKNSPELLKRIPLKEIALFIGVTPEALSRIRKRLAASGGGEFEFV